MEKVNWIPALVFQSIALGVSILVDLISINSREAGGNIALLFLPALILSIVFTMMLHYKCWNILLPGYRQTTPGRAVGFLFIPFYNLYWVFISYPCLAGGYYRYGKKNNVHEINDQRGLAIAYAVLLLCSGIFNIIPLLRSAISIAAFVIFVLFYQRIVSYANLVIDREGNNNY